MCADVWRPFSLYPVQVRSGLFEFSTTFLLCTAWDLTGAVDKSFNVKNLWHFLYIEKVLHASSRAFFIASEIIRCFPVI